ncbi:MAG: ABC transporter substrate-binding protein [Chloroflexi bacterium]|nr:ABC transporter substrate-binding protein [Chloroflexota bacterium]
MPEQWLTYQRLSRRAVLRGAAGLAGLGLLAACGQPPGAPAPATPGDSAASPGPLTKVRMACWSNPISEQANCFAAQEFGWWGEEGIDFEFVPGAGGGDALKHLLAGNADIAFTNVEAMLFAMQEGAKLRAVWNIYPDNVFNVVSLVSANIQSPADLRGKPVGVYSQASGTRYNLLVILRSAGLRESDVEVIATGVLNFGPLMEGRVAATAATDTGLWAAQQQGLGPHRVIWARDYLRTPTDVFVVTEETYQQRRELLRRFLRAYRKGTQFMLDHPEEAAQIAVKYATDGQDVARNLEIIKLRNAATVDDGTRANGLGWIDPEIFGKVEATFAELGIIRGRVPEFATAFTNEFVERG